MYFGVGNIRFVSKLLRVIMIVMLSPTFVVVSCQISYGALSPLERNGALLGRMVHHPSGVFVGLWVYVTCLDPAVTFIRNLQSNWRGTGINVRPNAAFPLCAFRGSGRHNPICVRSTITRVQTMLPGACIVILCITLLVVGFAVRFLVDLQHHLRQIAGTVRLLCRLQTGARIPWSRVRYVV